MRFLFHLLKRDASTRKFALRAREIRLAAASQAGGRSAANLRTKLAFASECKRPTWMASPKQKHPCWGAFVLEAPPGIGPGIKVLQTSALPLGYGALSRIQKNVMSRGLRKVAAPETKLFNTKKTSHTKLLLDHDRSFLFFAT